MPSSLRGAPRSASAHAGRIRFAPQVAPYLITSLLLLTVIAPGCAPSPRAAVGQDVHPTVVLISLDGFRWDYMDRYETPVLDRLASEGVRAETLIPIFPTKTFPNHYSAVTGLYAEHHGIISNTMYDRELDARFSLSSREAVSDARWWEGEPIWVTAETQGQIAATYFWPGSEAPIQGRRPTYWYPFDASVSGEERVDQVFTWLELPAEERPSFITLYFGDVDRAGHRSGTNSRDVARAVEQVDEYLGRLVSGLEERALFDHVHLIVISDHGMTETSSERVVVLDDYFDPARTRIVDNGPVLMMYPEVGREMETYEALRSNPHLDVYLKADLPDRYHLDHQRTPPLIAVAELGWSLATRAQLADNADGFLTDIHGFDNAESAMGGLFVARGPSFKRGTVVPSFEIIQLYELICGLLGLEPAPNDGGPDALEHLLTRQGNPSHVER